MSSEAKIGTIGWIDLTTKDATRVRDFYQAVVGWEAVSEDMGAYQDYSMVPPAGGEAVAGICHAEESNANFPAQWLVYITVADVDASIKTCEELGGHVLVEPRDLDSYGRFCVIQDPAGAVAALIAPPRASD
jgi:predicted enzyme related to lactoylglutathione lyase